MKKFSAKNLFLGFIIVGSLIISVNPAISETVYVTIKENSHLNGREGPSISYRKSMRLYDGDDLEAIEFFKEWVRVVGGECGTSWVKAIYISSVDRVTTWKNDSGGSVNIRKFPSSKKVLKKIGMNKTVKIKNIVLGWGYTGLGWVDLSYFSQED